MEVYFEKNFSWNIFFLSMYIYLCLIRFHCCFQTCELRNDNFSHDDDQFSFKNHFSRSLYFSSAIIEPYVMKLLVDLLYLNMYQLSKWENYPSLFSKYSRYLNKRFCVVSLSRTFRKLRVS